MYYFVHEKPNLLDTLVQENYQMFNLFIILN